MIFAKIYFKNNNQVHCSNVYLEDQNWLDELKTLYSGLRPILITAKRDFMQWSFRPTEDKWMDEIHFTL